MKGSGSAHESSLLLTLEEISHLVAHSHDPGETLANIVSLIRDRFETDVCSVYLVDTEGGELVLGATLGLRPEAVGQIRMLPGEGLTGLVVETRGPVMVDDARAHPRFKYFPEVGEDPYHSFLGVPLVEGGVVQGVLVVQTREPRPFTRDEVRLLVAVGTQIAPLVSGARLLRRLVTAGATALPPGAPATAAPDPVLEGVGLGGGVGIGRVYIMAELDMEAPPDGAGTADPDAERARLESAIEATGEEILRSSRRISELVGEDHAAILQAQLLILQDRTIRRDLDAGVATGRPAEAVLLGALRKYVELFQSLNNPFFRERVFDLKDVFRRLYWHLRPDVQRGGPDGDRVVLVSREASVLDLFSVDPDRLAGVVVQNGGPHCHAAILARSLGLPMVGQVADVTERLATGALVRIDGATGRVEPLGALPAESPNGHAREACVIPAAARFQLASLGAAGLPRIEATINLLSEVDRAVELGVPGVGLYRTEFLLLARRTLPTEEEQVELYRKLLTRLDGRPASIRTFDLRPDKMAHLAHVSPGNARAFDWRRVLGSPIVQGLFRDQVRAILRAATAGPARILVPLVTHTAQLDYIVETVRRCREDLDREGLEQGESVPLGIMIETAAALPMVEEWAPQVDFLALGTSDLTASALGLDRDDPVGGEGALNHPGLLRMIRDAIAAAHRAGRPITACGELATAPEAAVALAASGIDALSMAIDRLAATRGMLLEVAVA
jgi:phosphotransferase system enzyme I (PtsP)